MENFLLNGKQQMLFLHTKKEIRKYWKITVPLSLLPITGKVLERPLYNNIFKCFTKIIWYLSTSQDLNKGDSCINQLLLITHEICKDVCGAFLDKSKTFDEVLIYS